MVFESVEKTPNVKLEKSNVLEGSTDVLEVGDYIEHVENAQVLHVGKNVENAQVLHKTQRFSMEVQVLRTQRFSIKIMILIMSRT